MVILIDQDFKYRKLRYIIEKMAEDENKVYFAHVGLVFTLLRYPMPTVNELRRLKEGLATVETSEDFQKVLCWLDEYDEVAIGDIKDSTPFITAHYKSLIYWLFSYPNGKLNKTALIHFLERYISPQPLARYFHDFINFGF